MEEICERACRSILPRREKESGGGWMKECGSWMKKLEERRKDETDRVEDDTTTEFERYKVDERGGDGICENYC